LVSTKCHIWAASAMVARGVRSRALRAHPSSDRLNGAHEPPQGRGQRWMSGIARTSSSLSCRPAAPQPEPRVWCLPPWARHSYSPRPRPAWGGAIPRPLLLSRCRHCWCLSPALRRHALDLFTVQARASHRSESSVSAVLLAARRRWQIMTPADLRRLHKYMLEIEKVMVVSDEMRAVVESEWPDLAHKLPLAKPQPWAARDGIGVILAGGGLLGWWHAVSGLLEQSKRPARHAMALSRS